jgi:hypothetical protein
VQSAHSASSKTSSSCERPSEPILTCRVS